MGASLPKTPSCRPHHRQRKLFTCGCCSQALDHSGLPEVISCDQGIAVQTIDLPHMPDIENKISSHSRQVQQHKHSLEWLRMLLVAGAVVHTCILQLSPDAIYSWGVNYPPKGTSDYATRVSLSCLDSFLQAFLYGLLFLIEGCMTPAAVSTRGPGQYLQAQAAKLLLPLAAWELLLRPLCFYAAHVSGFGGPAGVPQLSFNATLTVGVLYRWYFSWFRHYLDPPVQPETVKPFMTRNIRRQMRRAEQQRQQQQQQQQPQYFNHGSIAAVLVAIVACLATTMFLVLNVAEYDWSLWALNVQYCFVPQYVFAFCFGIYLSRNQMLHRLPPKLGQCSMLVGLAVFVVGWCLDFLSVDQDIFVHHAWLDSSVTFWNWWCATYTQVFAVLWSVGLLAGFAHSSSTTSPNNLPQHGGWHRTLASSAYGVYVLHPLVLVAFNLSCLGSGLHQLVFAAAAVPVVMCCSWLLVVASTIAMSHVDVSPLQGLMEAAAAALVLPGSCIQGLIQALSHLEDLHRENLWWEDLWFDLLPSTAPLKNGDGRFTNIIAA
eukprot:gene1749-biopygen3182